MGKGDSQETRTSGADERADGHIDVGWPSLLAVKTVLVACQGGQLP